jgi:hypothetical protein
MYKLCTIAQQANNEHRETVKGKVVIMTTIQTDDSTIHTKSPTLESRTKQIQKKYGFKVDKWITIREKNMFEML